VFNCNDDFNGSFNILDHNASDDLDGTNPIDISSCPVESECWKGVFTDYENYDFSIKDFSSPLFDAGVTITIVSKDILGTPRPYNDAYDIGAFEYTGRKAKYRFSPGGHFKFQGHFKFR